MNFIEELYYGNINPNEKRYSKCADYAKTMRRFCDAENELGKMLKGKPLQLVNTLVNASDEIVAVTSIEINDEIIEQENIPVGKPKEDVKIIIVDKNGNKIASFPRIHMIDLPERKDENNDFRTV